MCEEIRIYVADLAAYNNGILHGVWIDATDDVNDIQDQINKMLAESPEEFAEEYTIHDYEGFEGYPLGEYEGIQAAHDIACLSKNNHLFNLPIYTTNDTICHVYRSKNLSFEIECCNFVIGGRLHEHCPNRTEKR